MRLPDFELERYFARYEFEVPYLLSSSDIEPFVASSDVAQYLPVLAPASTSAAALG